MTDKDKGMWTLYEHKGTWHAYETIDSVVTKVVGEFSSEWEAADYIGRTYAAFDKLQHGNPRNLLVEHVPACKITGI